MWAWRSRWIVSGAVMVLSAPMVLGASGAEAQERNRPGLRGLGPGRAPSPARIMSMRERLDLSEDQLAALEEIRAEGVELRNRLRGARAELMSRFRAGEIGRQELRSSLEDLRAGRQETVSERRERIEGILDETQLDTSRLARERQRAFRRGQASMRGRGRPGMMGPRPAARSGRPMIGSGRRMIRSGRPLWGRGRVRPFHPRAPGSRGWG